MGPGRIFKTSIACINSNKQTGTENAKREKVNLVFSLGLHFIATLY